MEPDAKSGRYITMQGNNRFVEKAYTLKLLIAAAYDLNPRTISGEELAVRALDTMEERKITSLVVVDAKGTIEGVVHLHDLWQTELF